jgi:outer membrane protein OmpA-like peptidoglycan-associated protein
MSPAILRAALGSCLALGVADLAWLDLNAERMASGFSPARAVPIEAVIPAAPVERYSPAAPPHAIAEPRAPSSGEVLAPVVKTEGPPSPSQAERCVVHFDRGASAINDDQATLLTPIADALKSNPKATVRVEGHADRTGDKGGNLVLSDERAVAIVRALGELGVPRNRIRAAGFGDTRPVDDRSTEDAFRMNRRAEVRIELPGDR